MDLSLVLLIGGGIVILLALAFCFFGYKLARFLLPICGVLVLEALIYIFLYDLLVLNAVGTWLFFLGTIITLYILFFFLKRIAGFFTGLVGSALILTFIVYAFNIHGAAYLYPICLTICVVAGLLAVAYQRVGVIIVTSLLGACTAALVGLYLLIGVDPAGFTSFSTAITTATKYLIENGSLIGGVSIGLTIIGVLVQVFVTAYRQLLPGDIEVGFKQHKKHKENDVAPGGTISSDV